MSMKKYYLSKQKTNSYPFSDVLHPNRANVSKEDLRSKLADLYKANQDQVSVFGFRTQYGGGKSTGFALVYDSHEALKKFEPHYRLVRIGAAQKIEKASRQQRTSIPLYRRDNNELTCSRQTTQEPFQEVPGYCQDQGPQEDQGINQLTSDSGVIQKRALLIALIYEIWEINYSFLKNAPFFFICACIWGKPGSPFVIV
jgi:ribosomal protein S24E